MTLEERIETKKKQRKVLDAEIKFLQAQLEHKQSKQPKPATNEEA